MADVGVCHMPLLPKPPENASWASRCFGSSNIFVDRMLEFVAPSTAESVPVASCLRSEVELLAQKWEGSLFGFLLGKKPHLPSLKNFLVNKWNLSGTLELSFQTDGAFLLRFGSVEEKIRVLELGPWFVGGRLLVLKPWRKRMRRSDFNLSSLPIWIRLPNLPLEFWSKDSLSRIGSLFGNPLFCDEFTVAQSRTCFARICVEVGASSSVPNKIRIDVEGSESFEQEVWVEWRPPCCSLCKCFSHNENSCNKRLRIQDQVVEDRPGGNLSSQVSGENLTTMKTGPKVLSVVKKKVASTTGNIDGWIDVHRQKNKNRWKVKNNQIAIETLVQVREESIEGRGTESRGVAPSLSEAAREEDGQSVNLVTADDMYQSAFCSAGKPYCENNLNSNGKATEKAAEDGGYELAVGTISESEGQCAGNDIVIVGETNSAFVEKVKKVISKKRDVGVRKGEVEKDHECWPVAFSLDLKGNGDNNEILTEMNNNERLDGDCSMSNKDTQVLLGNLEMESSCESGPPGFSGGCSNMFKEKSSDTAIHTTKELTDSEEEDICFSSRRARMIREKLGISILGTGNADKAFADFCRSRQKEIETNRKKSVVPDVSLKLRKQVGKKGMTLKGESGRRIKN